MCQSAYRVIGADRVLEDCALVTNRKYAPGRTQFLGTKHRRAEEEVGRRKNCRKLHLEPRKVRGYMVNFRPFFGPYSPAVFTANPDIPAQFSGARTHFRRKTRKTPPTNYSANETQKPATFLTESCRFGATSALSSLSTVGFYTALAHCQLRSLSQLTLAGLETRILLVDHKNFAVTAHNLSARLVLQRPKGLTDLHRALLSSSAGLVKANHL